MTFHLFVQTQFDLISGALAGFFQEAGSYAPKAELSPKTGAFGAENLVMLVCASSSFFID